MPTEQIPCALRALTLCDGQVLEDPERALQDCLCAALRRDLSASGASSRALLRSERQGLIERTLAGPLGDAVTR